MSKLTTHLIVRGAAPAIDFYVAALGAKEIHRFVDHKLGPGYIVHAALEIGGARVTLSEENPEWRNVSPLTAGSSGVVLRLSVDDPDAVAAKMVALGAEVVFPISDQFYGSREGRLRDPFGHLWVVSKVLEALSDEEVQRRIDRFHD